MFTFFYEIKKKKIMKKYIFNWKRKLYIDLCEVQKKREESQKKTSIKKKHTPLVCTGYLKQQQQK